MPYLSIAVFAALTLAIALAWHLPMLVVVAYAAASAVCFIVYAIDKRAARIGDRRTSENTLLLLGLLCGWPGAILAQQWLRHKSSKLAFRWKFWCTVFVNVAAFVYLSSPASFLR